MITIKNESIEELELITHLDTTIEGCRVLPPEVPPAQMKPGETLCFLGYEPGISYTIRPVKKPEIPRTFGVAPGAFPKVRSA